MLSRHYRKNYHQKPLSVLIQLYLKSLEAALDAGAGFVNDVTGGTEDESLIKLVADRNVPYCIMHMQGKPGNMQDNPTYQDVCCEVKEFLLQQAKKAESLGVAKKNIVLDPGIGFGKRTQHNLELLKKLSILSEAGYPILLGTSRKTIHGRDLQYRRPFAADASNMCNYGVRS